MDRVEGNIDIPEEEFPGVSSAEGGKQIYYVNAILGSEPLYPFLWRARERLWPQTHVKPVSV